MKRSMEDYPPMTQRIMSLIEDKFNGNVRQFSLSMGLTDSAKINRLFKRDSRSGEYPTPSSDIILLISNTFNCSTDWIMKGVEPTKSVNNINIEANKISGTRNAIGDNNNNDASNGDYIEIIKKQQEQINELIKVLANGRQH